MSSPAHEFSRRHGHNASSGCVSSAEVRRKRESGWVAFLRKAEPAMQGRWRCPRPDKFTPAFRQNGVVNPWAMRMNSAACPNVVRLFYFCKPSRPFPLSHVFRRLVAENKIGPEARNSTCCANQCQLQITQVVSIPADCAPGWIRKPHDPAG